VYGDTDYRVCGAARLSGSPLNRERRERNMPLEKTEYSGLRTMPESITITPRITVEVTQTCPLFVNPREYLAFRKGKLLFGFLKRWSERRAIDKSLDGLNGIDCVCDVPCGPGRLFPYWEKRGYRIIGVDLSDQMVEAARRDRADSGRGDTVVKGDAFDLKDSVSGDRPNLIASVRFFYYFMRDKRIELLRAMAAASPRYLLLQYKTAETRKGKREMRKIAKIKPTSHKQYCSNQEIREELEAAGLECINIVPISQASDRIFVLAGNQRGQQTS
jgi:SAM-dependent methyltransferase